MILPASKGFALTAKDQKKVDAWRYKNSSQSTLFESDRQAIEAAKYRLNQALADLNRFRLCPDCKGEKIIKRTIVLTPVTVVIDKVNRTTTQKTNVSIDIELCHCFWRKNLD